MGPVGTTKRVLPQNREHIAFLPLKIAPALIQKEFCVYARATPTRDSKNAVPTMAAEAPHSSDPSISTINNGMVEFALDPVQKQLICPLCNGYFREPYTLIKCSCSFCKSCLFLGVHRGNYKCPLCTVYLGQDVDKVALPDRVLQNLIDKILFPSVAEQDRQREEHFYECLGIDRKTEYASSEGKADDVRMKRQRTLDEEDVMVFELLPDPSSRAPAELALPVLETDQAVRIGQLKKYLDDKLRLKLADPLQSLEILCNSVPLGNELSVQFTQRTVWESKEPLTLYYRFT